MDELKQPTAALRVGYGVRGRLILLGVMGLLPLALMATLWLVEAVSREQQRLESIALETARSVVTRLGLQLAGHVRTVETLAALPMFDGEVTEEVEASLQRALAAQEFWRNVNLMSPEGRQLVNARMGTLSRSPVPEAVSTVVETARPNVTDVAEGRLTGQPAVALQVPVVRDGTVLYVLSAVIDLSHLVEVFRSTLPSDWRADCYVYCH